MNKSLILLASLLCATTLRAQTFIGLRGSDYGGITNVSYNPAIANSPYWIDINLIAAAATVNNNYVGVYRKALTHPSLFGSADFRTAYLQERVNGRDKRGYIGGQVQGPLSFMFS